jgi:replicative DNA helicase
MGTALEGIQPMTIMKTEQQLESEANTATKFLCAGVAQLMHDGVEPASLVVALTAALSAMLAAAPRHMAERLDASVLERLREQRTATWDAVDALDRRH